MSLLAKWAEPCVRFLQGDARATLPTFSENYFDCVVTSPPYFGLRDYGCKGQIGLEATLDAYLVEMVLVCREVRRVLKPSGTFWLNIGDSMKAKQLLMVPARLALALQADGWWLRSEIIWAKPNPMPESVTDRPTSAHEKIWLLTKSERYYFDVDAVREAYAESTVYIHSSQNVRMRGNGNWKYDKFNNGPKNGIASLRNGGRNIRNVWSIAPKPFKEAHFATFPPELAERCIKAGCPIGGHVLDPFGGAGTTGLVARRLGRNSTLVELNPEYIEIAKRRIANS